MERIMSKILVVFLVTLISCGKFDIEVEQAEPIENEEKEGPTPSSYFPATISRNEPQQSIDHEAATIKNEPHKQLFLVDVLENGLTCLEIHFSRYNGDQESISEVADENCDDSTIRLSGIKGADGIGCHLKDLTLTCGEEEINFVDLFIPGPQGIPGKDAKIILANYEDDDCFDGVKITNGNENSNNYSEKIICSGRDGKDGDKGDRGTQGIQGEIGLTGTQGDSGLQGVQGIQGEVGDSGSDGLSSLILTEFIDQEGDCPFSEGIRVSTGLDLNADGILNQLESTATEYICQPIYSPAYPIITVNDVTLGYLEQSDYQTFYQVMGLGEYPQDP